MENEARRTEAQDQTADGTYTAAEMIEIRMRATRAAKHDATIAEWERIEQDRIANEDARETIQPATDEKRGSGSGASRHVARNGVA